MHNPEKLYAKTTLSLFVIFFFFVSVPFSQAGSSSPLLLFFSGNIQGETEPCG